MPCPSVLTLKENLENNIPFLKGKYTEVNDSKQLRLQAGRDGGFNRHDAGLALDIFLFAMEWRKDKTIDWKNERILGQHLVKGFVDIRMHMNWTELIYEQTIFRHEPDSWDYTTKAYGDKKHYTHIHIDWMDNSLKGVIKEPPIPWSSQARKTSHGLLIERLKLINEKWEKGELSELDIKSI